MMGDMGRTYDGSYAEYTSVPLSQVIPVDTGLPWDVLGRLAGYFGDAADLPREAFQEILDAVAAGRLAFPVDRVYDGRSRCHRPTTTWSTTAPPASSSSASGISPPLADGPHKSSGSVRPKRRAAHRAATR